MVRKETIFLRRPDICLFRASYIQCAAEEQRLASICIFANIFIAALIAVLFSRKEGINLNPLTGHILGLCYVPLSLAFFAAIRNYEGGVAWIFLVFFIVFASDTGAYYAGTYLGKRKLCQEVSPGKTWEGFFGGIALVMVVGVIYRLIFFRELPLLDFMALCLFAGLIAPVGDLFESMLKRSAESRIQDGFFLATAGFLTGSMRLFRGSAVMAYKTYIF